METKYVRVPFEVKLAKKITEKYVDGRIVTRHGLSVRIICWDIKDEKFPLGALVCSNHKEGFISYTIQGEYYSNKTVEHNYDLMLEIPEYMTFKDGDVIVYGGCVLLFSGDVNQYDLCGSYCSLFADTKSLDLNFDYKGVFPETRLATEEEKQKLFYALKESNDKKAKEYLKRFFPNHSNSSNIGKNYDFKPFDKVLGRECETDRWRADLFSHMNEEGEFICIGYVWEQCIPYNDKTAHLLGTTENYE